MGRKILAVIVGYIVLALLVGLLLFGAYLLMGADRAFKPGGYEITTTWLITMEAVGIIAAIIGGLVCAKVSKHSKGAVLSLIALVVVLGIAKTAMVYFAAEPSAEDLVRSVEISNFEAMLKARTPVWVAALDPVVGWFGIMIGAMMVCPCRRGPQPTDSSQA